jgi:hypothetical protein
VHRHVLLLALLLPPLAALAQLGAGLRFLSLSVFVLTPLLASLFFGWRATSALCVYSLAVAVALTLVDRTFPPSVDLARLMSLLPMFAFAIVNTVVRQRRETRLRDVLAVSRVAQGALFVSSQRWWEEWRSSPGTVRPQRSRR